MIKKPANWETARRDAITRGGYLIEIDHAAENKVLFTQLKAKGASASPAVEDGGGARYVWLGGSDSKQEGEFVWNRSSRRIPLTDQHWGRGAMGREPDNFMNQDGLAISLNNWPLGAPNGAGLGNAGQWNDISTANKIFYVIEFNTLIPTL